MGPTTASDRHRSMLRIGEAADDLGVSAKTLRNWDESGKLHPIRHPVTGYRYYRQESLDAFLDDSSKMKPG